MNNRVGALGIFFAVACTLHLPSFLTSALGQDVAPASDQIVLLDGSTLRGVIGAIDASGAITGEGLPGGLELDGLRSVKRLGQTTGAGEVEHPLEIQFLGGGTLGLTGFAIDGNQDCRLKNPVLGEVSLPIEAFTAVRFSTEKVDPAFAAALNENLDEDRIFVKTDDGIRVLRGLIETVNGTSVNVDRVDGVRPVPRERVYGIVFAQIGRLPKQTGQCQIALQDGSTFWAKIDSLTDGKLNVRVAGKAAATIPWAAVESLKVRSTRLEFLSDLEPLDARHQPLVTLQRPMQLDRSIGGRPLTLSGRTFEKGLGVASRSVVSFANEDDFDLFAATIGIDDETEGRGDCIFVVEADGREIFRERVTGQSPPKQIALDIKGADRIALIVEPGEDLDLADHADWCDARFVRK